jgi:hypothetical protein
MHDSLAQYSKPSLICLQLIRMSDNPDLLKDTWDLGARELSDCVEGSWRDWNHATKHPRLAWAGWRRPWISASDSGGLVRQRTIPTERPPLVGEVSVNLERIEGVAWWAQQIPTAVNFRFSRPEPLLFFQVAPQLSSRGWVDPVPDPLLLIKPGSAGNRSRDLCICSQELWPLDHRGCQLLTDDEIAAVIYFLFIFISTTYIIKFSIYLFSKFFFCLLVLSFALLIRMTSPPYPIDPDYRGFTVPTILQLVQSSSANR